MAPLDEDRRRQIGLRAASLDDLLAARRRASVDGGDRRQPSGPGSRAVAAWSRIFAPGDEAAFDRRLSWDGLDRRQVRAALDPAAIARIETPRWTHRLDDFLVEAGALAAELEAGAPVPELGRLEAAAADEPPFVELLLPVARAARRRLVGAVGGILDDVAPPALSRLEDQLLREIGRHAELVLYHTYQDLRRAWPDEPGSTPAEGFYRTFVVGMLRDGLVDLFQRYPVLARQLVVLADDWVDAGAEMLRRWAADRRSIEDVFGGEAARLASITPGLSDRHHGGRRVAILEHEGGLRVVYKPRDLRVERAFNELLRWLEARGLGPTPPALRVATRDGYGWVEVAEAGELDDEATLEEYHRRAGALVCIAWVLAGSDLHMENVIATPRGPVLIDSEVLLQPEPIREDDDRPVGPEERLARSCIGTGLLTFLEEGPDATAVDTGGLRGRPGAAAPVSSRRWRNLRSDAIDFVPDRGGRTSPNRATLKGEPRDPGDDAAAVIDGFEAAYEHLQAAGRELLSPGGLLAAVADAPVRILFRPSTQYGALLHLLAAPRYQQGGVTRSLAIDSLNRVFNREPQRPLLWPLVSEERLALEALDIPVFTVPAATTTVTAWSGEEIRGYLGRSGLEVVEERIEGLDDEERRRQVEVLRWALATTPESRMQRPPPPAAGASRMSRGVSRPGSPYAVVGRPDAAPDPRGRPDTAPDLAPDELLPWAVWIGDELLARADETADGGLTWRLPWFLAADEPLEDAGLYSGAAGVVLFLVALGATTGDDRWMDAARRAAVPVLRCLETEPDSGADIGAGDGLGSLVYAFTTMAALGAADLLETAKLAASRLTVDLLDGADELDVVGGVAGAVLGLLAYHEHTDDPRALELAVRGGERLLAGRIDVGGTAAWPRSDRVALAGFAHGAAGIAWSLVRLAERTRQERFLTAARDGFRFEAGLFSPERGNWRLERGRSRRPGDGADWMTAWCHGAPGVGLARVLSLPALEDAELREEIEVAMRTTAEHPLGRWDHLCCGNLGRADAMLTGARRLGEPRLERAALALTARVATRAAGRGHFGLPSSQFEYRVFMPGFFLGLAGIGYQLLRAAAPERLPSVLALEVEPQAPVAGTTGRSPAGWAG